MRTISQQFNKTDWIHFVQDIGVREYGLHNREETLNLRIMITFPELEGNVGIRRHCRPIFIPLERKLRRDSLKCGRLGERNG